MGSPFFPTVLQFWRTGVYSIRKTTKTTFVYRKKLLKGCTRGERMEGEEAADGGGGGSGWRGRGQRMEGEGAADGGAGGSGWRGRGQRMLSIEDKK